MTMLRTKEHCKKISEALTGKSLSEERKQKISQTLKERFETGDLEASFKGRHHSEETKKNHSDVMKGRNKGSQNGSFKGYYVTPWGKFDSLSAAVDSIDFEIGGTTLFNYCKKSNNQQITKLAYKRSDYLRNSFSEDIIGKTYKEIGFDFISS